MAKWDYKPVSFSVHDCQIQIYTPYHFDLCFIWETRESSDIYVLRTPSSSLSHYIYTLVFILPDRDVYVTEQVIKFP